ncbi:MAG: S8 family peptidase [Alloprevotella sp.]
MKHIITSFAFLLTCTLSAQTLDKAQDGRIGPRLTRVLKTSAEAKSSLSKSVAVTADSVEMILQTDDAARLAAQIQELGGNACVIDERTVVANVQWKTVGEVVELPEVRHAEAGRRMKLKNDKARADVGADKVHAGTDLESGFTGKGVVVGVIDCGFEYAHPAFSSRVKGYVTSTATAVSATKPYGTSDYKNETHATHVTGIAVGEQVGDSPYKGMAPGADVILAPSDLSDAAILRQAKAIKTYAEAMGQPWVINMSFGTALGAHDGTSSFDRAMDAMVTDGGFMVAAAGNEADYVAHAQHVFTANGEKVYIAYNPGSDKQQATEVWNAKTDGSSTLSIRPAIWYSGKIYVATDAQIATMGSKGKFDFYDQVQSYNNRQLLYYESYFPYVFSAMSASLPSGATSSNVTYLLEVSGNAGDAFHAWIDTDYYYTEFRSSSISGFTGKQIKGDNKYLVCEGGACIDRAVAVAAYNTRNTWTDLSGYTERGYASSFPLNDISYFSNYGPYLGSEPKPAVAAPGSFLISSVSKLANGFDPTGMAGVVNTSNGSFYYDAELGTSMSCPVVTGVVALWLEAYPEMTYEQLMDIIRTTSRRDTYTGEGDATGWDNRWGYGKVDAYVGLKKALELKRQSGISQAVAPSGAFTFSKEGNAWRILFHDDEAHATVRLLSADGKVVKQTSLSDLHSGADCEVSVAGVPAGVYFLHVSADSGTMTQKVMVK